MKNQNLIDRKSLQLKQLIEKNGAKARTGLLNIKDDSIKSESLELFEFFFDVIKKNVADGLENFDEKSENLAVTLEDSQASEKK